MAQFNSLPPVTADAARIKVGVEVNGSLSWSGLVGRHRLGAHKVAKRNRVV